MTKWVRTMAEKTTFMRRPVAVEAAQFIDEKTPPDGVKWDDNIGWHVTSIRGLVAVSVGEWIVDESDGVHCYPIADEEFSRIYAPAQKVSIMNEQGWTDTVSDISDNDLLRRAVRGARDWSAPDHHRHPRWVAVSRCFALGSTYATQLCRRFDFDPEEKVSRSASAE